MGLFVDQSGWFWVVVGRFSSFWLVPSFVSNYGSFTIIPRVCVGYEMIGSQRGA